MEPLVEEIKIRAPKGLRARFEKMAEDRHLKVADVVREALREYVEKKDGAEVPGA